MSYNQWILEVDEVLIRKLGVGVDDLADCGIVDMHEDGMTPKEAAAEIASNDSIVQAVYGDEDAVWDLFND